MPDAALGTDVPDVSLPPIGVTGGDSDTLTEDAILDGPVKGAEPVAEKDAPLADAGKTADAGVTEGAEKGKPDAAAEAVPGAMPKELTALLKDPQVAPKLQAVMPQIQSAFDQLARIREVFPTVRAVHEFAEAFPGGLEDAKAAAQKASILDAADDEFKGAPETQRALAEEWHADDPQAFASMFVQSAQVLQEKNPEQYEQITSQVFLDRLDAIGFTEQIEGFRRALESRDAERLKSLVAWMVQESDKRGIQWKKDTGRVDPTIAAAQREREAAKADRSAAFNERMTLVQGQIGAAVHTTVVQSIAQTTAKLLEGTAFSDKGKEQIRTEIRTAIDTTIKADRGVQRQVVNILKAGIASGKLDDARKQIVQIITTRAKALTASTSKKVIEDWTGRVIASNADTNARRAAAGARTDVGAGGAAPAVRTRKLTPKDTEGMTDDQILDA